LESQQLLRTELLSELAELDKQLAELDEKEEMDCGRWQYEAQRVVAHPY